MSKRVAAMKEDMGRDLSPGFIARVAAGVRYALTGVKPLDWFGPGQPLVPVAQQEARGRQFDYETGANIQVEPRANEPITFRQLRALADNHDLMRVVIETRKDQLAKLQWTVQAKDPAKRKETDPRIQFVTGFLTKPDREHDWGTWVRALVEDMLVVDAATIYPRRDRAGRLWALELMDGATIKRVIDDSGRTPQAPDPAYQQILKGVAAVDYSAAELLYCPRNVRTNRLYGYSPVEQVVMTVNIALRRQLHQLQYYTEGNVPEALLGVPDTWTPDQIRLFQEYWDAMLEGNTAQRRHAKFVPGSIAKGAVFTKDAALKDDYDEWLARIICYAFSVSNQWAVKQMNRATSDNAQEQALQEGLAPLQAWIKSVIDRVLVDVLGFPDLEFVWAEEEEMDPAGQNAIVDIKVRTGRMTLDEARVLDGFDPYPEGLGAEPLIFTATGAVRLRDVVNPQPPAPVPAPSADDAPPHDESVLTGDDGNGDVEKMAKGAKAPTIDRERPSMRIATQALQTHWAHFLAQEGKNAAERLAGRPMAKADDGAETGKPANEPSAVDAAIDAGAFEAAAETAEPILADIVRDGIGAGAAAVGDGVAAEIAAQSVIRANPSAVAYAAGRSAELVGGLTDTTRDALRALVAKAEAEGWSAEKLQQAIVDDFAFSARRAWMIARTEVRRADVAGNLANWRAMRELGASIRKRWVVASAHDQDDVCDDNAAAGILDLDEEFPTGEDGPPAHPNCACDLVPVVGDAEGEDLGKAYSPDQPRDGKGRWAPAGRNRPYDAHREAARGRAAMDHVIASKTDVHDAMEAPGLGSVGFVWGRPGHATRDFAGGYGVAKIIAKRNAEGNDGAAVARKMPEVIAHGTQMPDPRGGRVNVTHEGHTAVLSLDHNGARKTWLLTGWKEGPR
ncbi:MAG: phage portal protein [Magnetospirillum sp.]|nr:phage portal protein [Magnetospirillum sp.]